MQTIVFDIETIIDTAAAERCHYVPDEGEFAPWPLHSLACVSLLKVERVDWNRLAFSVETLSRADKGEKGIIDEFEQHLAGADQILSFNGRGFDVPVLLTRAAIAGIAVPTIAQLQSHARLNHHLDLLEVVTGRNAAPRIKLAELCAAFSIPAKMDAGGADVTTLAAAGDFGAIARYCETDVVATWIAAQMWDTTQLPGHGCEKWEAIAAWIEGEQPRLEHLLPYSRIPAVAPPPGSSGPLIAPSFERMG